MRHFWTTYNPLPPVPTIHTVSCLKCGKRHNASETHVDLYGPAFAAYYCQGCFDYIQKIEDKP